MSTLKVAGNPAGGGDVTLQGPASAVTRNLTLPDADGTLFAPPSGWLSPTRAFATNYTNNTGRIMFVSVEVGATAALFFTTLLIDGLTKATFADGAANGTVVTLFGIVPPGSVYRVNHTNGGLRLWSEF